ncbi:MAG TPA: hypothetical protein VMH39_11120 [Gemmatimonadaceae bacterium]|nr:hypothetical protein [Gemmatimonadaceae bacterium]
MLLLVALQIATASPPRATPKDSARLVQRVRDAEFHYLMYWRHEWETWRKDVSEEIQDLQAAPWSMTNDLAPPSILAREVGGASIDGRQVPDCPPMDEGSVRKDVNEHDLLSHFIRGGQGGGLCPDWIAPFRHAADESLEGWINIAGSRVDEAFGIDFAVPPPYRDSVRARRATLVLLFDSAAAKLPGDRWIAGQRVRLLVDQQEPDLALGAATACRAEPWWCGMLRGYVEYTNRDLAAAQASFDAALSRMPPDTACRWSDLSELLSYSARVAYDKLSCAAQASLNARIWWLADPLYLEPGNERRTEHFARRVLGVLHRGNDADERYDMRADRTGPGLEELVLRYGWPSAVDWTPPFRCPPTRPFAQPAPCYFVVPPEWNRLNTHSVNLGVGGTPYYWGPRSHTFPSWSAITDPLRAQTTDWELGPDQLDASLWDSSWWAPEFYARADGPLLPLSTQVAFLRRHATAVVATAVAWPTETALVSPPAIAHVGVITSGGPEEAARIADTSMDGAYPVARLTAVESRPLLLGVEMVPENEAGPAARTRFGVDPPKPLSALPPAALAVSDVILARAAETDSFPASVDAALRRMYGSTTLVNPTRLAVFWEVYGQHDRDTVDVSLRIVRQSTASVGARAAAAIGLGFAGDDSLTIHWREPRPGDPLALTDSGASIRPRGYALNVSGLAPGRYTLVVRVERRDASASSTPRQFIIIK